MIASPEDTPGFPLPILGNEDQHAALVVQPPDDAALRALEHLHERADRAAARIGPAYAYRGAIAVHEAAHLVRRHEDRRAAFVGHEEAVAVGMALHAPGEHLDALRDEQRAGAVAHDVAGALESNQPGIECAALARAADMQTIGELSRMQRLASVLELAQDLAAVVIGWTLRARSST